MKYSSGKLTVTLNTNGSIRFSNPAPSLSGIEIGRLFDRYFTVENAKGSTGIGLSVAKLLTEKLGGSIDAEYRDNNFNMRLDFR